MASNSSANYVNLSDVGRFDNVAAQEAVLDASTAKNAGNDSGYYMMNENKEVVENVPVGLDKIPIIHCLCPRPCRQGLVITVPDNIPEDTMTQCAIPDVMASMDSKFPNYNNFVLGVTISPNEEDPTNTDYNITFLHIPIQTINAMCTMGFKKCIFYVGFSEDKREYPMMNKRPHSKDLAKVNREGGSMIYESQVYNLS